MRAYRILRGLAPSPDDFTSLLSQGRPIPQSAPEVVRRKWGAVSVFSTLQLAARRAQEKLLGGWWAALELPPEIQIEEDPPHPLGRHMSIYGATPEQLLSYVAEVGEFDFEEAVE